VLDIVKHLFYSSDMGTFLLSPFYYGECQRILTRSCFYARLKSGGLRLDIAAGFNSGRIFAYLDAG
jgi:hypothetical protein